MPCRQERLPCTRGVRNHGISGPILTNVVLCRLIDRRAFCVVYAIFYHRQRFIRAPGLRLKPGATMTDELRERFPKLTLQATQLPTGEWIVASPTKPLTEDEAEKVVMAYQTIQELVARGLGR